jgi:hypothetical protein
MSNNIKKDDVDFHPAAERKWRLAKIGAVMICLSYVIYGVGVFLAMRLSAKMAFFGKTSSFLAFCGASLVAWSLYVNYFRKKNSTHNN